MEQVNRGTRVKEVIACNQEWIDSTAGVCAACGMLELAKCVSEEESKYYTEKAIQFLKACDEHFCNYGEDEDALMGDFVADESSNTEDIVDNKVLRQYLLELIDEVAMTEPNETSRERTKTILIERFGLDGKDPRTLEQLGKKFGITRERVRQIEAKGLRKMRHPSRTKKIRDYL